MTDRREFLIACVAAAAALAGGVAAWHERSVPEPGAREPVVSREALGRLLASQLDDHRGQRQSFSQWKGKLLVVNFWATWCAPCREEMPYFSRLNEENAARGVQFVGISIDSSNAIRDFAEKHGVTYPLLIGGPGTVELSQALGNRASGLPHTLIIGRNGEPLLSRTGRLPESELGALLKSALTR